MNWVADGPNSVGDSIHTLPAAPMVAPRSGNAAIQDRQQVSEQQPE